MKLIIPAAVLLLYSTQAVVNGFAMNLNEFDERISLLENRYSRLSSRVLSLEYALKDIQSSHSTKIKDQGAHVSPPLKPSNPQSVSIHPEIATNEVGGQGNMVSGEFRPRDCSQIREELDPAQRHSTYYTIYPVSRTRPLEVFCDMHTLGGGWTVVQRRGFDGEEREDFNRTWKEYQKGFGEMGGDFWLGLDNIVALTKYDDQEVLYELLTKKDDGQMSLALVNYDRFKVDTAKEFYKLHLTGFKATFSNTPNFYLDKQDGVLFSTKDKDNAGTNNKNCRHHSGWWLQSTICHRQPDLNMPFDNGVLHLHKFNVVQDRHGVSIKVRARLNK